MKDYKEEYDLLVEEIAKLRSLMFKSIVDDSSEWYPSLMSSPLDNIIFLQEYFAKIAIQDLTKEEVLEVATHSDGLEYNQDEKIMYFNFNGRRHFVAEGIWINLEHFKNALKERP